MYLIPAVRREGTRVRVALSELRIGYDSDELSRWQRGKCQLAGTTHDLCVPSPYSEEKQKLIARLTNDGRVFGRPPSVYWDHTSSSWPAFRWSQYLTERHGFEVGSIASDAWHASARASGYEAVSRRRVSRQFRGTETLRRFLPDAFFHDFATLVEENADVLPSRATRHDLNVDIFAGKASEWCFFEVVRGAGSVAMNQKLFLSFASFLLHRIVVPKDGATPWRVGVVRFDSGLRSGLERETPEALLQEFRIPKAWAKVSAIAA